MSSNKRRNPVTRGLGCLALIVVVAGFLLVGVIGNMIAWAWAAIAEPRIPDSVVLVLLVAVLVGGPLYVARQARKDREVADRLHRKIGPLPYGDYRPNGHDGVDR